MTGSLLERLHGLVTPDLLSSAALKLDEPECLVGRRAEGRVSGPAGRARLQGPEPPVAASPAPARRRIGQCRGGAPAPPPRRRRESRLAPRRRGQAAAYRAVRAPPADGGRPGRPVRRAPLPLRRAAPEARRATGAGPPGAPGPHRAAGSGRTGRSAAGRARPDCAESAARGTGRPESTGPPPAVRWLAAGDRPRDAAAAPLGSLPRPAAGGGGPDGRHDQRDPGGHDATMQLRPPTAERSADPNLALGRVSPGRRRASWG